MEDEYEGFIQFLKNKKEEDENKGDREKDRHTIES